MLRKSSAKHFPITGPWPSEESEKIKQEAIEYYNVLVAVGHDYVVLISSSHWATQGYWVELEKKELHALDVIIYEHQTKK